MHVPMTPAAERPADASPAGAGPEMHALAAELFPICRSITGPGVRQTLGILQRHVPLDVHEVPTGTPVFDWIIPREWRIRGASLDDAQGRRLVDFRNSNLHVVGYSTPFDGVLSLEELRRHVHTIPERADWIPYRTSYYREQWGLCLSHRQFNSLGNGPYHVRIDSELVHGALTYGELLLPGRCRDEVLFSCHVCHPSLANDNLSGIVVAVQLAKRLAARRRRRYSYRFLFAPGTIGAITWLARNEGRSRRIKHGLVLALLGDGGPLTYKESRRGDAEIDRIAAHVVRSAEPAGRVRPFEPYGYDERQFCSPGFNLPVGTLTRTPHGEYPEYHTSADNLELLCPEALADSLAACERIVDAIEGNVPYRSVQPKCEPQLGRRGLYRALSGMPDADSAERAMLWVLNSGDGRRTLLDVAERSGIDFCSIRRAAVVLRKHGLIRACRTGRAADAARLPRREVESLQRRIHKVVPGGSHTYAKGDDQYPTCAPPFLVRGRGCRVVDAEGRRYIEYGAGLRSVTLGHAHPAVVRAARRQLGRGTNFNRPTLLELECAETLLDLGPAADMVKFGKHGSDCTTAAVKLARAYTGRDLVAVCADHPFFSTDDWFLGTTNLDAGIPEPIRRLTVTFRYNDPDGLRELFERHPGQVACVVMEAATYEEPEPGYLGTVHALCRRYGALLVLDEVITGFRWQLGGAQAAYGVQPDLSVFGKGMANGFALSALCGRREVMERGGLRHAHPRVFLLSTTNGAETHALAAGIATMRMYRTNAVIERLYAQGDRLRRGAVQAIVANGLEGYFDVLGRSCNLIYATRDAAKERSQAFRTLFLQEMIRRGIIAPSLVVSCAHDDRAVDRTITAMGESLEVYRKALEDGPERYLAGRPVQPVNRRFN